MATKVESSPASAAVDEAIQTLSEAAQLPSSEARRIFSASNSVYGDIMATNRQLFHAWASGVESMLKAAFEAESSVFGTWPEVVKEQQKATLAAMHSSMVATEKLLTPAA
jgi:hypothetical protein